MAMQPFLWSNNQAVTPGTIARQRAVAEALAAANTQAPNNLGEGLNAIGRALAFRGITDRAAADEAKAREAYNTQFAQMFAGGAQPDMEQLVTSLNDPWASEGQSSVVNALLNQRLDPTFDLRQKTAQLGYDQALLDYEQDKAGSSEAAWDLLSADEATSLGLPPGASYQRSPEGKIDPIGTGSGVTINTGENSGPFKKKADEEAATRMSEYVSGGNDAANFIGDLETLTELGKSINTGKGAQVTAALGPYAEALGVDIDGLGELQAFDAVVSRMAPAMRVPGSGASSDFDARQFLKSLPALGNDPEGNQVIIETFQAIQERKIAAAQYASQALNGEITWQEADRLIRDLGDPYTAFNEFRKRREGGNSDAPKAGQVVDGYRFKGGDPSKESNWEKV